MNKASYLPVVWPNFTPAETDTGIRNTIHACTTLRTGGFSTGDYHQYNLASHVGNDKTSVMKNRARLRDDLQLPAEPVWLDQVHSNRVLRLDETHSLSKNEVAIETADASVTDRNGVICAVLTADCLPVFFCNRTATEVAVAHAGWRGLHDGIITNTVEAMLSSVDDILVNLGPAIGPQAFEVGEEVVSSFVSKNKSNENAFIRTENNRYLCDIYQLARIELISIGITHISGGNHCTYSENHQFYSYRRQASTGRMASLIWMI